MQSGKTGCGLYTAFKMLQDKTIQNCFIISGMSDTSIKTQWQNEIRTLGQSYLRITRDSPTDLSKIFKKLPANIYFNRNLEHITDISKISNSLIIIDEIHYGSTAHGSLHRFLHKFGLQNIIQGQECSILPEHNIYILSITATRANEDSIYNNEEDESVKKYWGRVYMEPGDSYKSIMDYHTQGLVHSNIKLEVEMNLNFLKFSKNINHNPNILSYELSVNNVTISLNSLFNITLKKFILTQKHIHEPHSITLNLPNSLLSLFVANYVSEINSTKHIFVGFLNPPIK